MFPGIGGASQLPPPRSGVRRLAYLALGAANRLVPKSADKVVLHSTIDLEDGILAILAELTARGFRPVVLLEQPSRAPLLRALAGPVRTVPKRSVRALAHFLTARHVMTTENVFGNRRPPASQTVVNIWHGEPPTKIVGRFFAGQTGYYSTYAPVLSTLGRAYRAAEFDMSPLAVPIVGAPRNDRMLRSDGPAVRRLLLGEQADRPTFLWLPSFRTGQWGSRQRVDVDVHHPGVPFAAADLRRLDGWLLEHGAQIVVKLHPHDVASFSGDYRAIRALTQQEMEERGLTLYTLLPAFDALITDVSSIWIDHLLTDRPLVFAFPDVSAYREGRGLNLEPYEDWVPGPFVHTMDELLDALGDVVEGRDTMRDERRRARLRFHQYHDDQSTTRLLDGLGLMQPSDADTAPAPGFPTVGGAGQPPPPPSRAGRLVSSALATANRLIPKAPRKVVLNSSVDLEDGLLSVIQELDARGWQATVLLQDPRRGPLLRSMVTSSPRLVPKRSLRGLREFLTARYVMTTHNVYGNRQPPPSQVVVSLWHGEPPTKVVARFDGQGALRTSYAPVCSTVGRAYRSAEFDLSPLRVPIIGAPRNDRMLRADASAVRRSLLGDDADRTTFFWLPSFRTGQWGTRSRTDAAAEYAGVPFSPDDVHQLDDWLGERDARVVVKLHPRDANAFTGEYRSIRLLAQADLEQRGLTVYPALSAFDALITDMSSVWLDYLLTDKPMIFAFPDVESYRSGRGLNLEPYEHWVPGPFVTTIDQMLSAMADVVEGRDPMAQERRRARSRFHQFHDDRSTARLLDGLGITATAP